MSSQNYPPDCPHWQPDPDPVYAFPWGPFCRDWLGGVACRRPEINLCPTLGLKNAEIREPMEVSGEIK